MKGGQRAKLLPVDHCDCHLKFPWEAVYYYVDGGDVKKYHQKDITSMPPMRRNQINVKGTWFPLLKSLFTEELAALKKELL